LLDPLASEISSIQAERQRQNRKRKRHERDEEEEPLRLRQIYTEGLELSQVWEQARRVVEAARKEIGRGLSDLREAGHDEPPEDGVNRQTSVKALSFEEDGEDSVSEDALDAINQDEEDALEGYEDRNGGDSIEGDDAEDEFEGLDEEDFQENGEFIEDPNGLNDGFFSIDDFNRQSQFLEQIDARGDPDDGAASDEEEIDWAVDPLTENPMPGAIAKHKDAAESESEQSDGEDDGPTFGDIALDTPEGASGQEDEDDDYDEFNLDDHDDLSNANNIMYADFFAPPAGKASKKQGRPMPHNFPLTTGSSREERKVEEDDIERTMAAVHRDIFSDEDVDEENVDNEESDPNDPKSRRSTYERRQAALLSEIRKLEAQNVAKRSWTLSGEARANDRPLNSLLEEDLDFERTGKPVPVITKEVSEDIEALIKRRILNREFDEVLRRRPDEILTGPLGRRGALPEVDGTRSKKGLAELYEEEYQKRTDPNYVDPRDEKLKKEHREIEQAWKEIASKLDSLCSWHYRPRPVEMSVQVRTDAPTVAMEDARPSGVGGVSGGEASQLAPQEVYRSGQEKDEVVAKGGEVVKRDELTREQKLRRRRREKERLKKAMGNAKTASNAKTDAKKQEMQNVVAGLRKGGVTVIGRKGELLDVEGNAVKGKKAAITGGSLKL
jgi:U3 small nucleolar RNA-associated protein MPP10